MLNFLILQLYIGKRHAIRLLKFERCGLEKVQIMWIMSKLCDDSNLNNFDHQISTGMSDTMRELAF